MTDKGKSITDFMNDCIAEDPVRKESPADQGSSRDPLSQFKAAMKERTIFYGSFAGVEELERVSTILRKQRPEQSQPEQKGPSDEEAKGKDLNGPTCAYLTVFDGEIKLCMPFEEVFKDYPIDENSLRSSKDHVKRQKQMAIKLIGARTPYQISKIIERENELPFIVISRIAALKKIVTENFFAPDAKRKGFPKYGENDYVDADIVSVGASSMMINVAGVDTLVNKWDLSYKPLGDLRECSLDKKQLAPGETIQVQITKVTIKNGHTVSLCVNHKSVERLKAQHRRLSIGTLCLGTVSHVTQNKGSGALTVHCWIKYYDVPAIATYTPGITSLQPCSIGTEVRLKVYGIYGWKDQERVEAFYKKKNEEHPETEKQSPQLDVGIYKCNVMSIGPTSIYGGLY